MTTYLITGGAGFIGSNLCDALIARGERVLCVDNFNTFYDPALKRRNIAVLQDQPNFVLYELDIRDADALTDVFARERPSHVAHFAGMANPRQSIKQPREYAEVNVVGTLNLLQAGVEHGVKNFVITSTSSVYGIPETIPYVETDPANRPISPYGATKKASEMLAFTYHELYSVPMTVIRPFTVYGPRGRPDKTPDLFVEAMLKHQPITLYNGGRDVFRDWTFIDDFISGFLAALDTALPFEIINLGNAHPIELRHFLDVLQEITGLEASVDEQPVPKGEPLINYADIGKARRLLGYNPQTSLEAGLTAFWRWYTTTNNITGLVER